jgi:hypothetical protein
MEKLSEKSLIGWGGGGAHPRPYYSLAKHLTSEESSKKQLSNQQREKTMTGSYLKWQGTWGSISLWLQKGGPALELL